MSDHKLSRRGLLRLSALAGAGALLAACTPQVVKETVVVQQTVVVEKTKEVEKVVTSVPKQRRRSPWSSGIGPQTRMTPTLRQ